MTCADVRERFHLFWLLYIVLIRNHSQRDWSVEAIEDILPYMALILGTEFIIDWMKHSFIIKFNNLSVDIYPEYKLILAQEFIRARNPANCIEHADLIRFIRHFKKYFLKYKKADEWHSRHCPWPQSSFACRAFHCFQC